MRSLNARERTLVELFFLQGKKYREIAALTGVAQNSIGPTLGRALSKLRTALTT
jgi:RNA polymerase sigma factor (sigma-70 family)